ncbi:MAG: hypothetical protein M1354_02395 [Candidatus Marsarchaeota archaeon]|jgi:hypothetical protein|nr:hypothetical protein [Candidatus Marsarchaeota archaeon]
MRVRLVRDRYSRIRGGKSKLVRISCRKCKAVVMLYQKDGPGWLKRCYLNRIFGPERLARLQNDKTVVEPEDMPVLRCGSCRAVIGIPSRHKDNRLAFRIIRGSFIRRGVEQA